MKIPSRRFYTDKKFRKTVIINSASLRNINWNKKDYNSQKQNLFESIFDKNNNHNNDKMNIRRLNASQPIGRQEKILNENMEDELKKREILKRKREISYRARKRIILRIRGENQDKEKENEKNNLNDNKTNVEKKLKEIEIKYPVNKVRIKRWNSNDLFKHCENTEQNSYNLNNDTFIINDFSNLDEKSNISNLNNNTRKRNHYVLNVGKVKVQDGTKNIKNEHKKILTKINLNQQSCKILKLEKCIITDGFNNGLNTNNKNKKSEYLIHEKKVKNKNFENISYNIIKINNNSIILNNMRNRKRKNSCMSNKTDNDIIENNYFNFTGKIGLIIRKNSEKLQNKKNNLDNEKSIKSIIYKKSKDLSENRKDKIENKIRNHSLLKNYLENKKKGQQLEISQIRLNNKNKEKPNYSSEYLKNFQNKTFKSDSYKTGEKKLINNNSNIINFRPLSKINILDKNDSISLENNDNSKNNYYSKKIFMIYFFEELIEISNSLGTRSLFISLLKNFNQKYYNLYENNNKDIYFRDNENFEYIFKHYGLILVSLIFLSKDEFLYSSTNSLVKELLIQLIYSSLNYVEIEGNKDSIKIQNFIKINNSLSIIPNHRYTINLIQLIFNNKKEYIPLKNALVQLHNLIIKRNYKYLIKILKETILFCYNSKPKTNLYFPFFKMKNYFFTNNEPLEQSYVKMNNSLNSENMPNAPFIKSPMKKKFCLVLDIDETISHTLKLSCGFYFLLRPGTIEFLKQVSKYYEIIIFTSSPKHYADNILNKIDIEGNLISYRLYKNHVIFENGKSVKKLSMIGRDLKKTIFIDNLRSNAKYNIKNLCSITSWTSDIYDDKLIKLKDKLINIATCGKYNDDITKGL